MSQREFRQQWPPTSTFSVKSTEEEAVKSRVFVGNLPTDHMEGAKELQSMFEKYGKIHDVSVHKGFGFVQFGNPDDSRKCVLAENGNSYKGLRLDVKVAVEGRVRKPEDRDRSPLRRDRGDGPVQQQQCRFWRSGNCNKGDKCFYRHDDPPAVDDRVASGRPGPPGPSRMDGPEFGGRPMRDQPPYRGEREMMQHMTRDGPPSVSQRDVGGPMRNSGAMVDLGPSGRDVGLPGREMMGPTARDFMGPTGRDGVGPTGRDFMGPSGRDVMGPPGRDIMGPTGRDVMGPSGRDGLGSTGRDGMGPPGRDGMGPPGRDGMGPPGRDSMGLPGRDSMGLPGRDVMGLPGRDVMGLPGRDVMGPPGRDVMGPPGRDIMGPPGRDIGGLSGRGRDDMSREWQQNASSGSREMDIYRDGYDRVQGTQRHDGYTSGWDTYAGEPSALARQQPLQHQQHQPQQHQHQPQQQHQQQLPSYRGDSGAEPRDHSSTQPPAAAPVAAAAAAPVPKPPFDCILIACQQQQRGYCETIERRLRALRILTNIHVPKEKEAIQELIVEATRRGVPFAIVVTNQNEQHRSLTLSILHGTPQEHRNMPLEDAMSLVARNFDEYVESMRRKQLAAAAAVASTARVAAVDPAAVPGAGGSGDFDGPDNNMTYLLNLLADGRPLTLSELDQVLAYVETCRDKAAGVTAKALTTADQRPASVQDRNLMHLQQQQQQTDLQAKILTLLGGGQSAMGSMGPGNLQAAATMPPPQAGHVQQPGGGAHRYGGGGGGPAAAVQQGATAAPVPAAAGGTINFDNPLVQRALENLITSGPSLLQNIKGLAPAAPGSSGGQPMARGGAGYNNYY